MYHGEAGVQEDVIALHEQLSLCVPRRRYECNAHQYGSDNHAIFVPLKCPLVGGRQEG